MPEPAYETRPLREDDRDWLSEVLPERWGGELIVGRGRVRQLPERSPPAPAAHSRIDDWAQAQGQLTRNRRISATACLPRGHLMINAAQRPDQLT